MSLSEFDNRNGGAGQEYYLVFTTGSNVLSSSGAAGITATFSFSVSVDAPAVIPSVSQLPSSPVSTATPVPTKQVGPAIPATSLPQPLPYYTLTDLGSSSTSVHRYVELGKWNNYAFMLGRHAPLSITLVPDTGSAGLGLVVSPSAPTGDTLGSFPVTPITSPATPWWSNQSVTIPLTPYGPFSSPPNTGTRVYVRVTAASQGRVGSMGYSLVFAYGPDEAQLTPNSVAGGIDVSVGTPTLATITGSPGSYYIFRVYAPSAGNVSVSVSWARSPSCPGWSCYYGCYGGSACDAFCSGPAFCSSSYGTSSNPPPASYVCYSSYAGSSCPSDTLMLWAYHALPTATTDVAASGIDSSFFDSAVSVARPGGRPAEAVLTIPDSSLHNYGAGATYYFVVRTWLTGTVSVRTAIAGYSPLPDLPSPTPWPQSPTSSPTVTASATGTTSALSPLTSACVTNVTVLPHSDLVGAVLSASTVSADRYCAALCCDNPACEGYSTYSDPALAALVASLPPSLLQSGGGSGIMTTSCYLYGNVTGVVPSTGRQSSLLLGSGGGSS